MVWKALVTFAVEFFRILLALIFAVYKIWNSRKDGAIPHKSGKTVPGNFEGEIKKNSVTTSQLETHNYGIHRAHIYNLPPGTQLKDVKKLLNRQILHLAPKYSVTGQRLKIAVVSFQSKQACQSFIEGKKYQFGPKAVYVTDLSTKLCYNCFQEGHIRNQCVELYHWRTITETELRKKKHDVQRSQFRDSKEYKLWELKTSLLKLKPREIRPFEDVIQPIYSFIFQHIPNSRKIRVINKAKMRHKWFQLKSLQCPFQQGDNLYRIYNQIKKYVQANWHSRRCSSGKDISGLIVALSKLHESRDRESLFKYHKGEIGKDGPRHTYELSLLSLNVQGLNDQYKQDRLLDFLTNKHVDIAILTETRFATATTIKSFAYKCYNSYHFKAYSSLGKHSGVTILCKQSVSSYVQGQSVSFDGRCLSINLHRGRKKLNVIGIYYPSGKTEDARLLAHLQGQIQLAASKSAEVIIAGDFNGVIEPQRDRSPMRKVSTLNETDILEYLKEEQLFVDIWREHHTNEISFTHSNNGSASRIDMFLIQDTILATSTQIQSYSPIETTHFPITMSIMWYTSRIARPMFGSRINVRKCTKTEYQAYQDSLNICLAGVEKEGMSLDALHEIMLNAARQKLPMTKSGRKHKLETPFQAVKKASEIFRNAKKKLRVGQRLSKDLTGRVLHHLKKLDVYVEEYRNLEFRTELTFEKMTSIVQIIRRREKDVVKFMQADLIKKAIQKRDEEFHTKTRTTLDSLLDRQKDFEGIFIVKDEDMVLSIPDEVIQAVSSHYKRQFAHGEVNHSYLNLCERIKKELEPKEINPEVYVGLMEEITFDELQANLTELAKGKAPGKSGIVGELLQNATREVQECLLVILNKCIRDRVLPSHMQNSMLYLLPKIDCWHGEMTDIRPISLLEPTRKLFSSIMTKRCNNILWGSNLLRGGNCGFTKGISTDFVTVPLRYLIDHASKHGQYLELTTIDVQKAYDSVPIEAMRMAMERIRMPQHFIDLVIAILSNRQVCCITGYGLTDNFRPMKGLEQGDAIAPTLWNIFYDTLLCVLDNSGNGVRLQMNGLRNLKSCSSSETFSQVSFADDLHPITGSREATTYQLRLVADFMEINGMSINVRKCMVVTNKDVSDEITFQSVSGKVYHITNIQGPHHCFKILGAYFTMNGKSCDIIRKIQELIKTTLEKLNNRKINFRIYRYVLNAVLVPKICHLLAVQCLSDSQWAPICRFIQIHAKRAAGFASTTGNHILYNHNFLGVAHLAESWERRVMSSYMRIKQSRHSAKKIVAAIEEQSLINVELNGISALNFESVIKRIMSKYHVTVIEKSGSEYDMKKLKEIIQSETDYDNLKGVMKKFKLFYDLDLIDRQQQLVVKCLRNSRYHADFLTLEALVRESRNQVSECQFRDMGPVSSNGQISYEKQYWDIYTDGSLEEKTMGGGFVIFYQNSERIQQQKNFKVTGSVSSTTAEIWAVIQALRSVNTIDDVTIHTDCQAIVNAAWNQFNNLKNFDMEGLAAVVENRNGCTHFKKVNAHTGDWKNDLADAQANEGRRSSFVVGNETLCRRKTTYFQMLNLKFVGDIGKIISQMQKISWNQTAIQSSQGCKIFEKLKGKCHSVDSLILGEFMRLGGSLKWDPLDKMKLFNIKKSIGLLPTNSLMSYRVNISPQCSHCAEEEDTDHIYSCKSTENARNRLFINFDTLLRSYGIMSFMNIQDFKQMLISGLPNEYLVNKIHELSPDLRQHLARDIMTYITTKNYEAIWRWRCANNATNFQQRRIEIRVGSIKERNMEEMRSFFTNMRYFKSHVGVW